MLGNHCPRASMRTAPLSLYRAFGLLSPVGPACCRQVNQRFRGRPACYRQVQTRSLRIRSYKSWRVNTTASPFAKARLKTLELYATLRQEGCSSVTALEAHSTRPRRQRQRQWTKQHEQQVLHLRQRHRLWGKRKLWKVLCRDQGFTLSACLQQAG